MDGEARSMRAIVVDKNVKECETVLIVRGVVRIRQTGVYCEAAEDNVVGSRIQPA